MGRSTAVVRGKRKTTADWQAEVDELRDGLTAASEANEDAQGTIRDLEAENRDLTESVQQRDVAMQAYQQVAVEEHQRAEQAGAIIDRANAQLRGLVSFHNATYNALRAKYEKLRRQALSMAFAGLELELENAARRADLATLLQKGDAMAREATQNEQHLTAQVNALRLELQGTRKQLLDAECVAASTEAKRRALVRDMDVARETINHYREQVDGERTANAVLRVRCEELTVRAGVCLAGAGIAALVAFFVR